MKTEAKYTDEELIHKILNKETALFELVIRRNNPYLYRIGKMYHFSHEDTQDLMQETYIQGYTNLKTFEFRSSLQTWLSKIMVHQCYKKTKSWAFKNIDLVDEMNSFSDKLGNTEIANQVMNTELNSIIEKSLLQIPEKYRTVFTLREINGLSVLETSEILEITESNVKVRLNRSKSILRKEIEKFYNKEEIFEFNLIYCDAIVNRVMRKIIEIS